MTLIVAEHILASRWSLKSVDFTFKNIWFCCQEVLDTIEHNG